ncbi:MAG TPA: XRE family transcriptional regulator [Solirubrobacterales bacterium]|nr:XRE family transcriptional regulator [Solirubrobacterales bacterium]
MELTQTFLGARILRARESAKLSQGELADLVGLTQSAISRIESGERSVESLELARLAKALAVSVLDLLEERPLMEELLIAARSEATESAGLDRALNRVVDLVRLEQLVREADQGPAQFCQAESPEAGGPIAEGEYLARLMRERWCLDDDPMPNNFESLIEDLSGLSIALEPLSEQVAGLYACVDETAIALVDSSVPLGRQRFTVAHELCHFLLRDTDRLIVDERLTGKSNAERRANAFAAHFLMPAKSVRRYLREREPDEEVIIELVHTFGVSLQALLWHLFNLDLLSRSRMRRIQDIGLKSLSIRYGYGDVWQRSDAERGLRRPPRHLRERVTSAYDRGAIGLEPLADLLGRSDLGSLRRELEDQGIGARENWWEETTPT